MYTVYWYLQYVSTVHAVRCLEYMNHIYQITYLLQMHLRAIVVYPLQKASFIQIYFDQGEKGALI